MTSEEVVTPDRMNAFSDGVFAVIITILVLELRPPNEASFGALLQLWPTAISYAISYLFIAIVWVNHHHLLRFPDVATHRLIWGNFAHLFAVSLIPFATAWIARTRLGAVPVAFYAGDFFLVNATYLLLGEGSKAALEDLAVLVPASRAGSHDRPRDARLHGAADESHASAAGCRSYADSDRAVELLLEAGKSVSA